MHNYAFCPISNKIRYPIGPNLVGYGWTDAAKDDHKDRLQLKEDRLYFEGENACDVDLIDYH